MTGSGLAIAARAAVARGLMVVAVALLLPLAAVLPTAAPGAAQSAPQGSLWVSWETTSKDSFGQVCANPSAATTSSCFSTIDLFGVAPAAMATDGVNVYFAGKNGGVSCPIVAVGGLCTHIMAGGWGGKVKSLAAAGGKIWIGQDDGKIFRCPGDMRYSSQSTMPSLCVLLDDAGARSVDSLLLANGRLYAGLGSYGIEQKKQGILWSCDPQTPNACENLDTYGHTTANSLAAGGGYLWAGLDNGIILRCNPNVANRCDTWDNAGTKKSVASISHDGQGTLYAALYTKGTDGLVWSCPIATANACSDVKTGVNASSVSAGAGAGGVFWSAAALQTNDIAGGAVGAVYSNATSLTTTSKDSGFARLLYIPAGGPAGVGGAKVTVEAAENVARKLARGCRNGKNPTGTVVVSWDQPWFNKPYIFTTTFKACNLTKQGVLNWSYGLLNVGDYTVTVTVGKYSGYVRYSLQQGKKKPVFVSVGRR